MFIISVVWVRFYFWMLYMYMSIALRTVKMTRKEIIELVLRAFVCP